jgi:hypothetical protein
MSEFFILDECMIEGHEARQSEALDLASRIEA